MLATLADEPPEGDEWQHEIKFDGYRTQLHVEDGAARAFSRRGYDWSAKYRNVIAAACALPCDSAILDGEVIIQDASGRSDYDALRSAIARRRQAAFVFMAFDLLHLDGRDLQSLPLEQRRSRLRDLLGTPDPTQPLHFSDELVGNGPDVFAAAERMGLEGIVSKQLGSRYRSGRARAWVKTKTLTEEEFVVIGTSKGDRAPVALLAREHEGKLTYVGAAMVTLPQPDRDRFWEAIERIRTPTPPLPMDPRKETGWAKPEMRVCAKFLRGEEPLRHATVTALLELPSERPKSTKRTAKSTPSGSSREPPLPNPQLDADALRSYYETIAPALLEWTASRPLNLLRCQGNKCWFQRNLNHPPTAPDTFPPSVGRLPVRQKNGKTEDYLFVEDVQGVRACVAANVVEFHGWGSSIGDIEKPDRLVIDLDPDEGLGFEAVREAALAVREAFSELALVTFPMLTGGKGVHVIVPLLPGPEWPEVRAFAYSFCLELAELHPERFTVALPKLERRGRIFLDYLRNQRTSTAILPYSARAREGAPVAAPLTWDELAQAEGAAAFTINDSKQLARRAKSKKLAGWGKAEQSLSE